MRKLASIRRICNIRPIEGADLIEVATVEGWECVVSKKDNFQVNDNIVYFEIDSILPEKPEFEFLRNKKFRIKTIKLKGQVSQGLVMPLSILPKRKKPYELGEDVTEILGVTKYDPEMEKEEEVLKSKKKNAVIKFLLRFKWFRKFYLKNNKPKHIFPSWVIKTDEERIQNCTRTFEIHKAVNTEFEITEKLDGMSATYTLRKNQENKYDYLVCSRNCILEHNESAYWKIADEYNMFEILKAIIGDNEYVTIQGEIIGSNIQGNKYKINGIKFYVFNVIINGRKLPLVEFDPIIREYGLMSVPLLATNEKLKSTIPEMVEYAKGKTLFEAKCNREGMVWRNYERGISFKVINPDFLLKECADE